MSIGNNNLPIVLKITLLTRGITSAYVKVMLD